MSKIGNPEYPIHELILQRWSPYAFSDRPVSNEDLRSLFEAARWAASSYNEQPWHFLVIRKENTDVFDRALNCLVEGNRGWAKNVPVLVFTAISETFARNGKPNAAAEHDLGLAMGNLSLEATARGLSIHQMIGVLPAQIQGTFEIPESVKPLTAFAVGYAAIPELLPDDMRDQETAPRTRKPISDFVFEQSWGERGDLPD